MRRRAYMQRWYLKKKDEYLFKSRIRWLAKMALKEVLIELGLLSSASNNRLLPLQDKIELDMPMTHPQAVPLLQVSLAHHLK